MHTEASDRERGMQQVMIRVKDGFSPGEIRVKAGRPVRLVIDRQEEAGCSDFLVIPELGVREMLHPYQTSVVEFALPEAPGAYEITCGLGRLTGLLTAERERPAYHQHQGRPAQTVPS